MIQGVVRSIDELGRITLPIEIRRGLDIYIKTKVDMWLDGEIIRIKLYEKEAMNGIVRCTDNLGRICLPKEYRKALHIENEDPVDMYLDGQVICVKPLKIQCVFCGSNKEERLIEKNGVHICLDCIDALVSEVE